MDDLIGSVDDAQKQLAETQAKSQQLVQQRTQLDQNSAKLDQQMEPLLIQLRQLEAQLQPFRDEKKRLDDLRKQSDRLIEEIQTKRIELDQELYYYSSVKDPKSTKPSDLSRLATGRLMEIYYSLFGECPYITKHFPYSEVKWHRIGPDAPEYRGKLIDAFPKCVVCDTVCHKPASCPRRICDLCKTQGHSHTQCPQRTCSQCKKQGHDQVNCPDFKCQICDQAGHGAKDCPIRTQKIILPTHHTRGMQSRRGWH